jgi:hypothetical protein
MIEERFRGHRHAEIILSMPGFGVMLGAEFLAATGETWRPSTPPIAWPASADSRRYRGTPGASAATSNALAATTAGCCAPAIWPPKAPPAPTPASRTYYERKRAEGKHHRQAIVARARRRVNVLWAMLRDHTPYETSTATAA